MSMKPLSHSASRVTSVSFQWCGNGAHTCSHAKNRRIQGGFSLLEVIAAVLLLAIAFAALMQVAGGAVGLTRRGDGYAEAAMWARSKLDSVFVFESPTVGVTEGQFDKHYHWRLRVIPWRSKGVLLGDSWKLCRVDLEVSWGAPSHSYHARFSTLRMAITAPGRS